MFKEITADTSDLVIAIMEGKKEEEVLLDMQMQIR
jgi:hypothetical protein